MKNNDEDKKEEKKSLGKFYTNNKGTFYCSADGDVFVSSPLEIIATTHDDKDRSYGRLLEFKTTFSGNSKKKYADWALAFSNYVRKNYFRLWFEKDGAWQLTTAGIQLQKEMK